MTTTTINDQKTPKGQQAGAEDRLEANSQEAWLAVASTMPSVSRVIQAMLGPAGYGAEVEDITQEAIISAVAGVHRWDPDRGPLVSWVTTIGKRRALDWLRKTKRQATTAVVFAGQGDEDENVTVIDVAEDSFEDRLLDQHDAWGVVKAVLGQVKVVLRNDETMRRAVVVLAECDGDVAAAARWLGISPAVVREARRQVVRMAIVVHQAQELYRQKVAEVQIEAAEACLPDAAGSWTRVVLQAIRDHGNLPTFTPGHLRTATGWGLATSRQRLNDVSWLLSVINTIALEGEIVAAPATVPASMGVTA